MTNPSTDWTVKIKTGAVDGTLALTLADDDSLLDNGTGLKPLNGAGAGTVYGTMLDVQKTSPTLVAIERAFGAKRGTNDSTVVFKVTFSLAVNGVDPTDFAITCSDPAASVSSVDTIGNVAYVICNTGTAIGSFQLSVKSTATITNAVGLGYAVGAPSPNEDYYILSVAPAPTAVNTNWMLY